MDRCGDSEEDARASRRIHGRGRVFSPRDASPGTSLGTVSPEESTLSEDQFSDGYTGTRDSEEADATEDNDGEEVVDRVPQRPPQRTSSRNQKGPQGTTRNVPQGCCVIGLSYYRIVSF